MRISEIANRTGISQRMLRYYEDEGLLTPARDNGGYRNYTANQLNQAKHIRTLSQAGIKISSIKVLLPCLRTDGEQEHFVGCPEVKKTLHAELEKLNQKLDEITQCRNAVDGYLNHLTDDQGDS
ncbi:MerR family transcriptional regulator [Halioxenophilus aromaticivorans]|uniref:MerR family transcriptional regulator n=1 Tax=Halioxenophilus aromaticivorans TaxID=1306992 RepID=A0AAV3U855_9ALTE